MRFINLEDETDFIDFIVRKIDASTIGTRTERDMVDSLTRLKEIHDLTEKDVEKMTPEEIADLFNVEKRISDLKNNDAFLCVATSYTVMTPQIPVDEVLHTLPMQWINVICDFTVGGVPPGEDAIDGFKVEILDHDHDGK